MTSRVVRLSVTFECAISDKHGRIFSYFIIIVLLITLVNTSGKGYNSQVTIGKTQLMLYSRITYDHYERPWFEVIKQSQCNSSLKFFINVELYPEGMFITSRIKE